MGMLRRSSSHSKGGCCCHQNAFSFHFLYTMFLLFHRQKYHLSLYSLLCPDGKMLKRLCSSTWKDTAFLNHKPKMIKTKDLSSVFLLSPLPFLHVWQLQICPAGNISLLIYSPHIIWSINISLYSFQQMDIGWKMVQKSMEWGNRAFLI